MANILQGLLKEMHKFGIHISSITISMFQSILRRENSLRIDLEGNAKYTSMKSTNKCCPTCNAANSLLDPIVKEYLAMPLNLCLCTQGYQILNTSQDHWIFFGLY